MRYIFALIVTLLIGVGGYYYVDSVREPEFEDLVVFGDSLSDTGNVYCHSGGEFPLEPYYEGRFTNGTVWVEDFAKWMGLPVPTPSLNGGNNYAFGGARTGCGHRSGKPNIGEQIETYIKENGEIPKGTLVVLWAGGNDFVGGYMLHIVENIVGHVNRLADAGATHVLIPNFPPLGYLPVFTHELPLLLEENIVSAVDQKVEEYLEYQFGETLASYVKGWVPSVKDYIPSIKSCGPSIAQEFANRVGDYMGDEPLSMENINTLAFESANSLSAMYNNYLRLALEDLERKRGIRIYHLDIYSRFIDLMEKPNEYGFDEPFVPALDPKTHTLSNGNDPERHFFFDGLHPSSKAHDIIAGEACRLLKK